MNAPHEIRAAGKLNLGCGLNKRAGYVNVDKFAAGESGPDVLHDLEIFPWPFADGSIDEILAVHSLEHMGRDPDIFCGIMREIYRVAAPGARLVVIVPHPRHDHFMNDPTHVRPITPEVFSLFSKKNCEQWRKIGAANSPLALYHNVDFEIREVRNILDDAYKPLFDQGKIDAATLATLERASNNVVKEIRMILEVIK